jgi:hypothetical protein
MKKVRWTLRVAAALALMACVATMFTNCSKDEPPALALVSLTANGVDLNGAASATGVAVGADIVATFNVAVDQASANSAITLVRQLDSQPFPFAATVSGTTVTISPTSDFSTGTLFIVTFGAGLKSTENKTLTAAIERNFTSEGTFAAPGATAQWTFEDNANDIIGGRTPKANGVVAITYEAGRKSEAGKAAVFNGTTSIIEFANGDQLMNNGSWTISLWVKPAEHTDNANKGHFVLGLGAFYGFQFEIADQYANFKLAASYTNGTNNYGEDLWVDATGNLGWQGWTFSKDFRPAGLSPVIKNQWAHYVFTYNATNKTGTAYLNGERVKEQDFDNWPDGDAKRTTTGLKYRGVAPEVVNELALGFIQSRAGTLWDTETWGGYDFSSAKHFKGSMDDLIFYNRSLTQAEITAMYNSGKP